MNVCIRHKSEQLPFSLCLRRGKWMYARTKGNAPTIHNMCALYASTLPARWVKWLCAVYARMHWYWCAGLCCDALHVLRIFLFLQNSGAGMSAVVRTVLTTWLHRNTETASAQQPIREHIHALTHARIGHTLEPIDNGTESIHTIQQHSCAHINTPASTRRRAASREQSEKKQHGRPQNSN